MEGGLLALERVKPTNQDPKTAAPPHGLARIAGRRRRAALFAATTIMAAARRRAKKEARRQAYISAFGRAPTEAATCHISGVGLSQALVLQEAHFIIEACDDTGARQVTGGDVFTVAVRMASQGTRVRARVSDRGDGTAPPRRRLRG